MIPALLVVFPYRWKLQVVSWLSDGRRGVNSWQKAAISARIGKTDNERFREQFGYTIIASQLLSEPSAPSYTSVSNLLSHPVQSDDDKAASRAAIFGVRGAIFTAVASFSVVLLLHWARSIHRIGWSFGRVLLLGVLLATIVAAFYVFAKRQWLRYLRSQAIETATACVGNAQTLDSAASASVVLIQEVELVSRGYRVYEYTSFVHLPIYMYITNMTCRIGARLFHQ